VRESVKVAGSRPVPVKTIGILGFRKEPVDAVDPPRTRAMLAEAAIRGSGVSGDTVAFGWNLPGKTVENTRQTTPSGS